MVLPEGGWESRLLPHFSGEGLHDWRVICPSPFLFVRQADIRGTYLSIEGFKYGQVCQYIR